ncbi:MAG: hypothetical protein REI94_17845 [Moraxellaceae bacterium]|nr:hypothetical protein [Moraxellaceae bacterium]
MRNFAAHLLKALGAALASLTVLGFALPAQAQSGDYTVTQINFNFGGCTDGLGRAIPSQADPGLGPIVETRVDNGRTSLAYNPQRLPQLLPETRMFLFAHECARHQLNLPTSGVRALSDARRADCQALAILRRSGMLPSAAEVESIQTDLQFAVDDWNLLPGPPRDFQLASCQLPPAPARSATPKKGNTVGVPTTLQRSPAYSQCVQSCGSRLYSCGNSAACLQTFDRCNAGCEGK